MVFFITARRLQGRSFVAYQFLFLLLLHSSLQAMHKTSKTATSLATAGLRFPNRSFVLLGLCMVHMRKTSLYISSYNWGTGYGPRLRPVWDPPLLTHQQQPFRLCCENQRLTFIKILLHYLIDFKRKLICFKSDSLQQLQKLLPGKDSMGQAVVHIDLFNFLDSEHMSAPT